MSLLLSLFNLLPGLLLLSLEKGNAVSQDLDVFGGLLARDSLVSKSRGNRTLVVLNLLTLFLVQSWIFL